MRVTVHKRREHNINITTPTNGLSYDPVGKALNVANSLGAVIPVYILLEHAFMGHRAVSTLFPSGSLAQFLLPFLCVCVNLLMIEIMSGRGPRMRPVRIGLCLVLVTYWAGAVYSIVGRN